jgi:hypothetical protein
MTRQTQTFRTRWSVCPYKTGYLLASCTSGENLLSQLGDALSPGKNSVRSIDSQNTLPPLKPQKDSARNRTDRLLIDIKIFKLLVTF